MSSFENPTSARKTAVRSRLKRSPTPYSCGPGTPAFLKTRGDRAGFVEQRHSDALDPDGIGDGESPRDDPEAIFGRGVPARIVGEAVGDVTTERVAAAETRSQVKRHTSRAGLYGRPERERVGRRVLFAVVAAFVEERRQREGHISDTVATSPVSPVLSRGRTAGPHLVPWYGWCWLSRVSSGAGSEDRALMAIPL